MEKGYLPQDPPPPYPGPPINYGDTVPQPGMSPLPGYSPAGPPPAAHEEVTQMIVTPELHDVPGKTVCPHCQETVITETEHSAGLLSWLTCAGLAISGCFLCCLIPFFVDSSKDVKHRCPSCHKVIHIYKRMRH